MCFRKEVLHLILPFPEIIPMHDIWIGFVADLFFKVRFEPTKLLLYRRHDTTATNTDVGKSKVSFLGLPMFANCEKSDAILAS